MYGAILGDIIGSPYEFDRGDKTKDFEMFNDKVEFTDDSVMTIAVADALLTSKKNNNDFDKELIAKMKTWGKKYPYAGYGGRFQSWLWQENPEPYNSWGNGSAMRVSPVGWFYDNIIDTRSAARISAKVTHNHPEGIKGAEAVASVIYLARTGVGKQQIKEYVEKEFEYDLSRTCDDIRPMYHHVESCQETVPEAITAFLEGNDFEDVIRTAVSLGGDCDTLTCIAGSMAEAHYDIPAWMKKKCRELIDTEMVDILDAFEEAIQ